MDYRHLWLENGVFIYIWALLWSKSFASPVDYYPPWHDYVLYVLYVPFSHVILGVGH